MTHFRYYTDRRPKNGDSSNKSKTPFMPFFLLLPESLYWLDVPLY